MLDLTWLMSWLFKSLWPGERTEKPDTLTLNYECFIDHLSFSSDIKVEVEAEQEFKSIKKILYFNKYFHLNDWRYD